MILFRGNIQYEKDATSFNNNMGSIESSVNSLKEAVDHIAEALFNIGNVISTTTYGVENIAKKKQLMSLQKQVKITI